MQLRRIIMASIWFPLLTTFFIHFACQVFGEPDSLQRAYRLIKDELEHELNSDDIDKNLAKLEEILEREKSGASVSSDDKTIIIGLGKILALEQVEGPEVCNDRTYDLMLSNDHGTEGRAYVKDLSSSNDRPRRIDTIVHHYLVKRAQLCQPIYARHLKEIHSNLVADPQLNQLESFLNELIERPIQKDLQYDLETVGSKIPMSILSGLFTNYNKVTQADVDIIYKYLEQEAKGDADRRILEELKKNKSKASAKSKETLQKRLIGELLARPCSRYTNLLGPRVFEPALYEDQLLSERLNEPDFFDFYLGWARFKLCSYLANQPQELYEILVAQQ